MDKHENMQADVSHALLVEPATDRPGAALQFRPAKLAGLLDTCLLRQQLDPLHLLGRSKENALTLSQNRNILVMNIVL